MMGLIDRMQPRHQLVIKVASTFSGAFTQTMLREIFPYLDDLRHLPYILADLVCYIVIISYLLFSLCPCTGGVGYL
jgi:hypothetical protein